MKKGFAGKIILHGVTPSGALPETIVKMCSLLSLPAISFSLHMPGACILLTAATVLGGASCSKAPGVQGALPQADSLTVLLSSPLPYRVVDLFVFEDRLTRRLESHTRLGNATSARISTVPGDKAVIALANVRQEFARLPQSYDELEKTGMWYRNEISEAPLMTGTAVCEATDSCRISLIPILCSVRIESIRFEADAPLKGPVAYLQNVNAYCDLLKQDGFFPSQTLDVPDGLTDPMMMVQALPKDIGSTVQHPGTTLWCYPNESGDGPGTGPTRLCISGMHEGSRRTFSFPLKPMRRGDSIELQIELQ